MDKEIAQIANMKKPLTPDERQQFDVQYASQRRNPTTALILSLCLGGVGIDRFYIGHTGLGIGKLCTLGGIGVWALIDLFLIMEASRQVNMERAEQIQQSLILMRT